jgi:hypothetical protein
VGIWLSTAATVLALGAGAVFLLAEPGTRFRGAGPEAMAFSLLGLPATGLGQGCLPRCMTSAGGGGSGGRRRHVGAVPLAPA